MTCVPEPVIKHYQESRSLVSLTRDKIDSTTLQGFVVDFDFRLPRGGLAGLLSGLPSEKVVILEDETEDDLFLIGTFLGIEDEFVSLRFFSGAGRRDNEPAEIALEDVTSVSFSTNYTLAYERHFARVKPEGESGRSGD